MHVRFFSDTISPLNAVGSTLERSRPVSSVWRWLGRDCALTFARRNVVDEKSGLGEKTRGKTCTGGSRRTYVRALDGFTR